MVLSQFAHDFNLRVKLWVNTCGFEWSPVFVAGWRHDGLTSSWERRSVRSLSLFASWGLKAIL